MRSENCLMMGAPGLLASHVAARQLLRSSGAVFYTAPTPSLAQDFRELVRLALSPESQARLASLNWIDETAACLKGCRVWFFGDNTLRLRDLEASEINLVNTPFCGGGVSRWLEEDDGHAGRGAVGSLHRRFNTAMTIGRTNPEIPASREGLVYFFATLAELKQEIEERLPEYFKVQPLRCWMPAAAAINVVRVEDAAAAVVRIADCTAADGSLFQIGSPVETPVSDLLRSGADVFGLNLVGVSDRTLLNSIDLLFERRLCRFQSFASSHFDVNECVASLDGAQQQQLIVELQQELANARDARYARLSRIPESFDRRTIGAGPDALTYHAAGSGSRIIVVINAFGQGLRYWFPLIDYLTARQYRVIVWEMRGTQSSSRQFRLCDQVNDVSAILGNEGAERCSMVAWCTGSKVAVEFCKRYPGTVTSLILLNSTFKSAGQNRALDSEYERNFELFCSTVTAHPDMAAAVSTALMGVITGKNPDIRTSPDPEHFARQVLAMTNRDLRGEMLAPFRDPPVLVRYCQQILDFWSHDAGPAARDLDLPVLIIASELDAVASAAGCLNAASFFPNVSQCCIPGGNHYSFYDRADAIGEQIDYFVSKPG